MRAAARYCCVLSYRHGFHAGNAADVFKHAVLLAVLRAMLAKDEAITCIDTHAGAGMYDLEHLFAQKNAEYAGGVAALWSGANTPLLDDYLTQVQRFNATGVLRYCPGSPALMHALLRPQDKLLLCELHPTEQQQLRERYGRERQVALHWTDGYTSLRHLLPPDTRRALVHIDPSYELSGEPESLQRCLRDGLKRFGHGVFLVWYPLLNGVSVLPTTLAADLGLQGERWLDLRVHFHPQQIHGRMNGCGMIVINCPFRAREAVQALRSTCDAAPA